MDDPAITSITHQQGVSVVIPCYNYARFLKQAVDSVLAQDYSTFEVIVMDDGSKDETPEVAEALGDKIKYIRQENQGLSATRNNGIQVCQYDYIAFLDADDEWDKDYLSIMMDKFFSLSGDYGLIACLDKKIGADGSPIVDRVHKSKLGEICTEDLILKNRFFPGGAIVKKHVFDVVGNFDTNLKSSEDRDMWIRLSSKYKIWLIGDRLIRIRKHGDNMSANPVRMRENKLAVLNKAIGSGIVHKGSRVVRQSLALIYYQVSWIFYNQLNKKDALSSIWNSIMHYPSYMNNSDLDVPLFFRIRAFARFLLMPKG